MEVEIEAQDLEAVSEKWKAIQKYGIFKLDFTFYPVGEIAPVFQSTSPHSLQEGSDG